MLHSDTLAQSISIPKRISKKNFNSIGVGEGLKLKVALLDDARGLAQSAVATFFEGVRGLIDGRFTWATVKLYYAAFYAARCRLMLDGLCIFYIGRTPCSLEAVVGAAPAIESGNTHTVVVERYLVVHKGDVTLSQVIDGKDPLHWIEDKRNSASYKAAPFLDPAIPSEYARFISKPRAHLDAYIGEDASLYAFDREHAMVAFPLFMLTNLDAALSASALEVVQINRHFIELMSGASCYTPAFRKKMRAFEFV